jgi:methylamine--corrinoid protein Co-methyltransferase
VQSVVGQAFARKAPCILFADIYPKSGAGTPELLYETAANALAASVSGLHLEGVGAADGALPNASPLEVRLMADVGRRAAEKGLDLAAASRMVKALLAKYGWVMDQPGGNPGQPFEAVCDTETLDPTPAWQRVDEAVRAELKGLGVL